MSNGNYDKENPIIAILINMSLHEAFDRLQE
jgi:hypothetical protein